MTPAQLVDAIRLSTSVKRSDVERVLAALNEQLKLNARSMQRTSIYGFGTFYSVRRTNHEVKNIKTGARYKLPAYTSPQFRPARGWTDDINSIM